MLLKSIYDFNEKNVFITFLFYFQNLLLYTQFFLFLSARRK